MTASDIRAAVARVVDALEELGVRYHIGGSVASSLLGTPRTTIDIDLVAALRPEHIELFVSALGAAYYVDVDAVRDAVRRQASFNAIHLATMMKIDVFVLKRRLYDQTAFARMQRAALTEADDRLVWIASPEDIILNKLEWYRMGSEVSERQWRDVMGVVQVQGSALNLEYLRHWADVLAIRDLLERALAG